MFFELAKDVFFIGVYFTTGFELTPLSTTVRMLNVVHSVVNVSLSTTQKIRDFTKGSKPPDPILLEITQEDDYIVIT